MLNLSELTFKVNTDALVQAAEKIAALGKSVEGLQGSFSKLEKGAAASEKALAEANRKNAQAAKANAEAALLQAKALTEVERAENLKVKTIQASTKATEESTRSVSSNVSMLQRQQDIYGFMIEGFSRGQSSILATAKAAGMLADEMKTLKTVLQEQRALLSDPFDKSLSGLLSLKNELAVVTRVQSMYTAELGLTKKQMRELAVDEMRLTTMLKEQGKSTQEIDAALKKLNQEYIKTAGNVNQVLTAEQALERQRKDTADANNAIEREMQRVNYALQTQNNELNKGTANALFRFEQNLKRSGLTLAEQKKKLDDYRTSLLALEKAKGSTQTDYISRALGPQITDIFVGLATGQNPLTVMLQQGGQLRDQFTLAGVAAEDMGNTMRTAARSMVTSVAAVAGAFKDLLVGAFLDTGAALTNLVVQASGFNTVLDKAKAKIAAGGEQNFKYIGTLTRMGEVFRVAVGASLAASTVALLAFGVAMVQVMKAQDAMTIALVSTGASLGITTNQATEMAKAVDRTGASFSGVLDIFAMIAEKGNISAEAMQKITEAALKLEAVGGASVEKTVEQFSKLADDPVKALSEYTKATGLLTQAEIARIEKLVELGQETTAVKEATEMLSAAKQKESALIYAGLSPLSRIWLDIKNGIKEAWGAFQEFAGSSALVTVLTKALKLVAFVATEVWFAVKGIGESLGGLGAVAAAVMTDIKNLDTNFTSSKNVLGLIKETDEAREAAYKNAIDRIMQQGAYEQSVLENTAQAQAKVNKENSEAEKERLAYQAAMKPWKEAEQKGAKDLLTRQQFINKAIEDANKGLKEGTSLREKDVALIQKMAGLEWDKANKGNKPKKDPSENYYEALLRDSTNATIKADEATQDLTKSQLKMLEVINDPRFAKLSENQQTTVLRNYAVAASNEKIVEGQKLINKLLGKGEGLGKEYYATLAKLESLKGNAGIDQEQLEKALQALRDTTPEAKRVRDEIKAAAEAYNQYSANAIASLESTKIGNQQLDYRLSVLGKSTDEQRKMKIQQDASVKLMQAEVKYAKEVLKIRQDTRLQNDPKLMAKALQDAETAYAEERKLINREVAVEAAEDFQKEFDRISNGVTDSIVTALFEGGKSGSKKIRDLVVAELKKPVTLVVTAVVNTVLGSAIGSLLGGATASAAGSAGGMGGLSGLSGLSSLWDMVSGGLNIASVFGQKIAMKMGGWLASFGMETASELIGQFGAGMMNTSSIGAFSQAFEAGGAQMAGAIAGSVLNGFSGYSISKLISGGYQVNKYIDKIAGVASAIPGIGPIAGVVGGLVNRMFGRKLKESGIEGTFGGETGFEGRTYQYYKGGWFRSNKTKYGELDEETRSNFAKVFFDMKDGVSEMAKILGLGTESLEDFTYKFKVNLKGLSEEEATKKIQEQFKLMGEEMAKLVLTTDEYSLAEETRMDTLIRLSSTLSTVNTIFENMGMTMYDISLTGADAAYELSQLFGGLEQFTSAMSNYYDKFYSDSEKQILLQSQLDRAFKDLGVSVPKTRDEFRALVESQDLTTEEGRKLFAELMKLVAGFDALASQAEQLANARTDIVYRMMEQEALLLEAQGRSADADKKRREILDKQRGAEYERLMKINPELARLTAELWALEDAAVAAARAREIADTHQDLTDRILQQEAQLLASQGRTAEAERKRRELLDRQRARENERLMALNPELARLAYELWLLEDAAVAAANAAALEREISTNRQDYTDRILRQEAELLDAQGRTAEADRKRRELLDRQRARENERLMALNPELARLAYELWLLEDATAAATRAAKERKEISDDLYNALVKAVDAEKTLLDEQKSRLEETISILKSVFDILKSSVDELYGEVSSTASMQASEGRNVIAQAISTGILPDSKLLGDSIQAVRDEISNSLYATKADADKARLIFAAQLSLLKGTTEEQLTDAEKQLKAINTQISYLDNILKTAKEQLDAFLGNTEVLKSVDQALADLYAYLQNPQKPTPTDPVPMPKPVGTEKPSTGGGAVFGPGTNTSKPTTVNSDGNIVYADGSIGYRNSWVDNYGVKHYGFVSKEIWETERAKGTPGYPAYADGGYYQGGLALVGEEGPELINFSNPGQVYTAKQTANMLSGDSSEVVAELKTLRGEVIMLRAEVRADVSHNAKTAKLLDRVIPNGDSVKVTIS